MDTEIKAVDNGAEARKSKMIDLIRERRGTIANAAIVAKVDPVWLRNVIYRTDPLKVNVDTFFELARICGMNPLSLYKMFRLVSQSDSSK